MQAYEVIAALEANSGKLEKEAIVAAAYRAGCYEFFLGAQLAYSKYVTFGTKHVTQHQPTPTDTSLTWKDFEVLTTMLRTRQVTGNDAATAIAVTAEHCNAEMWDGWYRRVLLKDFRCGITNGTINKALTSIVKAGDKKAKDYMVEVFTCQLAQPREKYEKLMVGKKALDLKLDGARILAICDKDNDRVELCTRNGLVKLNFPKIQELIRSRLLPKLTRGVVLDGEMVAKTFRGLMAQLNRKSNVDTDDIKFAVFDFVWLDEFRSGKSPVKLMDRDKAVGWACRTIGDEHIFHIEKTIVDLDTPEGRAALEAFHIKATTGGFEGTMVKDPESPYVTKRSSSWIKIKPWVTVDLQVIELLLGDAGKKYENCMGRARCAGFDGESGKFIEVTPGAGTDGSLTDADRVDWWNRRNEFPGLTVEILGHEISEDKDGNYSIRHARIVGLRPDKDGTAEYDGSLAMIESKLGISLPYHG
jgi:DNA ligase-1